MSIMVRSMELEHPAFIKKSGGMELLRSSGHLCNCCHGRGWVWDYSDPTAGEKVECGMCGGSGELEAEVTVVWKAAGKPPYASKKEGKEVDE